MREKCFMYNCSLDWLCAWFWLVEYTCVYLTSTAHCSWYIHFILLHNYPSCTNCFYCQIRDKNDIAAEIWIDPLKDIPADSRSFKSHPKGLRESIKGWNSCRAKVWRKIESLAKLCKNCSRILHCRLLLLFHCFLPPHTSKSWSVTCVGKLEMLWLKLLLVFKLDSACNKLRKIIFVNCISCIFLSFIFCL